MKFEDIPRIPLTSLPTSFYGMPNLSKELGDVDLYIKRDDVMELAHGGNKTRKLEYVFADAFAKGADCVITMGGIQSNHVRQTVSAAAKLGMDSNVILNNPVPEMKNELLGSGNYLLDVIMGANVYLIDGDDNASIAKMLQVEAKLKAAGKTPYIVPMGASDGIGSLGYMLAAQELIGQWSNMNINPSHIFLGTGSCGTHAGLLLGLRYFGNTTTKVVGVSVSQPEEKKKQILRDVIDLVKDVIELDEGLINEDDLIINGDHFGKAYAYPTFEANAAVKLVAEKEGILLDPVYTGKAMAGMIEMIKSEKLENPKDIVFLHTGGAPALHPYAGQFL
ncbi:MAG: D-cysteine desulfhydrase family protein [Kordiimonadaceae bacterium]|jgi:L-cysteate sulfo-lyase|nr:D-cysteine desulfhydrase family protein [Kordiimonadaceae bacterium]MBT6032258.1 D-cysteine desulfhydrase family protein [Kordiimonadaceae bacterium]